jgi:hypothetical protein
MGLKIWSYINNSSPAENKVDQAFKNWGHYSLYRRYNVGDKTEFYDEATGASAGGPKWTYSDEVVRTRQAPMSVRGTVGISINASKIYLESSVKPKRGDVLIEVDYEWNGGSVDSKTIYSADHVEAFEIQEIDTKRGYRGKITFYLVQVVPHMGDY